jgi:hypothetical protein
MRKKINIGKIDIPTDYFHYDEIKKKEVCEDLLEVLYIFIDRELDEKYNRIEFLKEVLLSSLESNVQLETYEVAAVLSDCIKILNED